MLAIKGETIPGRNAAVFSYKMPDAMKDSPEALVEIDRVYGAPEATKFGITIDYEHGEFKSDHTLNQDWDTITGKKLIDRVLAQFKYGKPKQKHLQEIFPEETQCSLEYLDEGTTNFGRLWIHLPRGASFHVNSANLLRGLGLTRMLSRYKMKIVNDRFTLTNTARATMTYYGSLIDPRRTVKELIADGRQYQELNPYPRISTVGTGHRVEDVRMEMGPDMPATGQKHEREHDETFAQHTGTESKKVIIEEDDVEMDPITREREEQIDDTLKLYRDAFGGKEPPQEFAPSTSSTDRVKRAIYGDLLTDPTLGFSVAQRARTHKAELVINIGEGIKEFVERFNRILHLSTTPLSCRNPPEWSINRDDQLVLESPEYETAEFMPNIKWTITIPDTLSRIAQLKTKTVFEVVYKEGPIHFTGSVWNEKRSDKDDFLDK